MNMTDGRWTPNIGDPTVIGWVTVAAYFIVAAICLKATLLSKSDTNKSLKNLWLFLTFFLIALGINKQLDLQTIFTLFGKNLVIEQGWYNDRYIFQIGFIIFIGLSGVVGLTALLKKYKHINTEIKIALVSCIILFIFILIRAISFHYMDFFINMEIVGIKINWLIELSSLIIIGYAGIVHLWRKIN